MWKVIWEKNQKRIFNWKVTYDDFFFSQICFLYSCLTGSHGQKVPRQLRFSPLVVRSYTTLSPALLCLSHKSSMTYHICTRGRFVTFMWLKCFLNTAEDFLLLTLLFAYVKKNLEIVSCTLLCACFMMSH